MYNNSMSRRSQFSSWARIDETVSAPLGGAHVVKVPIRLTQNNSWHIIKNLSNDFIQNPVIPFSYDLSILWSFRGSVVPVAPWRNTSDAVTKTAPVPEKTSSPVKYQKSHLSFRNVGQRDAEPEALLCQI